MHHKVQIPVHQIASREKVVIWEEKAIYVECVKPILDMIYIERELNMAPVYYLSIKAHVSSNLYRAEVRSSLQLWTTDTPATFCNRLIIGLHTLT